MNSEYRFFQSTIYRWFQGEFRKLKQDAWTEPSIGPMAGVILLGLISTLIYLSFTFPQNIEAREAAALEATGENPDAVVLTPILASENDLGLVQSISIEAGYFTEILLVCVAMLVALQPIVSRLFSRRIQPEIDNWIAQQAGWLKHSIFTAAFAVGHVPKLISVFFSTVDFIMARYFAALAGAHWKNAVARYVHLFLVFGLITLSGFLTMGVTTLSLLSVAVLLSISVVRRWSWMETDRSRFLLERGRMNVASENRFRIGFHEDLRDEAIFSLALVLVVLPLLLNQVYLETCVAETGECAFFPNRIEYPSDVLAQFWIWLGYIGVELAKTIPLVDWSEVFAVPNSSKIAARNTLGAQIHFAIRVGFDLLFLATILEGIRITTRLHNQQVSFFSNSLPILEPFTERYHFRNQSTVIEHFVTIPPSNISEVFEFPDYDPRRLTDILDEYSDKKIHRLAVSLLAHQHCGANSFPVMNDLCSSKSTAGLGEWASASALNFPLRNAIDVASDEDSIATLILDTRKSSAQVASAIRALDVSSISEEASALVLQVLQTKYLGLNARCTAGVLLARVGSADAQSVIIELAQSLSPLSSTSSEKEQALTLAFALSWSKTLEETLECFDPSWQELVEFGWSIEKPGETAPTKDHTTEYNNPLIHITPGEGPFQSEFHMGAKPGDADATQEESPRQLVKMTKAFAIGKYPVTQEAFNFFLAVNDKPIQEESSKLPATFVDWLDARDYCNWLSRITGFVYRLPTEAEWEYCCRAGTETIFWWGDTPEDGKEHGNYSSIKGLREVGECEANPWGLFDMAGNVYEICAEPWYETLATSFTGTEAPRWLDGDYTRRPCKGGSWKNGSSSMRSSFRQRSACLAKSDDVGFRLVVEL